MSGVVTLWRIAAETRDYKADDLSGTGAAKGPGRWNAPGEYVVYTGTSIAIAVLETAAHIPTVRLPLNRFVVRISVPQAVWDARQHTDLAALDPAWEAIPAGRASVDHGSAWYRAGKSALLVVQSVIVPEEAAVLVNATHADAKSIAAQVVRLFDYDRVFRAAAP